VKCNLHDKIRWKTTPFTGGRKAEVPVFNFLNAKINSELLGVLLQDRELQTKSGLCKILQVKRKRLSGHSTPFDADRKPAAKNRV
jgi:hypothetical protein